MSLSDPILWVELVMLSALLTAGICAAWTDLRFQRVPNRYTLGLLGIGVAGQIAMAGLGVGGWNQAAGTLLLGLAVAFLLTMTGVWSLGDGKMYWAAVAALPPSLCPVGEWVSFETPPAALIVNALCVIGRAMIVLASEDTVAKRSILPVAWVGAVLMAAAVVLSMPEKAHADYCWTAWDCDLDTTPKIDCGWWCGEDYGTYSSGCVKYGSSGRYRCRCGSP